MEKSLISEAFANWALSLSTAERVLVLAPAPAKRAETVIEFIFNRSTINA